MKRLVRINCLIAVSIICLLSPQPSTIKAQPKQAAGLKVRSEMLVSTDWLAKHINDRDVFVIHVAADHKHYDDGHLPGARFLSSKEILTTRNGVANELPAVVDLRKVFEQLGVGDRGRIVIYGENSGLLAARDRKMEGRETGGRNAAGQNRTGQVYSAPAPSNHRRI